jgi:hypothetical protein
MAAGAASGIGATSAGASATGGGTAGAAFFFRGAAGAGALLDDDDDDFFRCASAGDENEIAAPRRHDVSTTSREKEERLIGLPPKESRLAEVARCVPCSSTSDGWSLVSLASAMRVPRFFSRESFAVHAN